MSYSAPAGTPVFWLEAERRGLKNPTIINLAVNYDPAKPLTFFERYAEGDTSPERIGSSPITWDGKRQGGESYEEVKEWKRVNDGGGEPSVQEVIDWSLRHGNQAAPLSRPTGERHNPIPVEDRRFPAGLRLVGDLWYFNDLSSNSEGRGRPMPDAVPVTPPPAPPPPPSGSGQQTRPIRYTFGTVGRSEIIALPPGTTGVLFKGTLTGPPVTGPAIWPWMGVRVGAVEGDRENTGMVGRGGRGQVRVEAGGVRSKEFQKGFGRVAFGKPTALEFEWGQQLGAGKVRILYGKAERTYETGVTEGAERGGRLTLGVDPGGEYQLLPAGTVLEGVVTIMGAASSPVPVDPPVVQPPAAGGTALAQALAHLDAARALLRTLAGLLLVAVLLSGLACKDRATVEKPRQPPARPVEQPVEVPAPLPVAPSPPMERTAPSASILPPGPVVAAAPAPVPAPVNERCYVLRVSGGVPRVTGSMACPAAR